MDQSTSRKKRRTGDNHQSHHHGLANLSPPWNDLLSKEVAKYLTLQDFVRLGAVSKKYRALLGTETKEGNRLLRNILQKSQNHYTETGELLYTEQLPTLGEWSEEESLQHNPVLVARLRNSARRRRSLILFPHNDQDSQEIRAQRKQVVSRYRAVNFGKYYKNVRDAQKQYPHLRFHPPWTKFVAVNLSGVNVYIHFIDSNGTIAPRDGDCIQPCANETLASYTPPHGPNDGSTLYHSIEMRRDRPAAEMPPHVFYHRSMIFHSFALCFEKGGPPFAIYQQRRAHKDLSYSLRHIHAISILPGGIIRELNCDIAQGRFSDEIMFSCRRRRVNFGGCHKRAAAEFAKKYYGLDLPSIYHPFWNQRLDRANAYHLLNPDTNASTLDPGCINHTGELFYEILIRGGSGDGDSDDNDESMLPRH